MTNNNNTERRGDICSNSIHKNFERRKRGGKGGGNAFYLLFIMF